MSHRRQRVRRRQAEIIMAMEFKFEIRRRAQGAEDVESRERVENAERIGETEPMRSGRLRALDHAAEEIGFGAAGILAADRDTQTTLARIGNHTGDAL
jgi:hypothetical protein